MASADGRPVRVRIAPSPTGAFHLGSARTAIFNWLYARHTGGKLILRIEDTDRTRFVPGAIEDMLESLRWLGIDYDEGPDIGGPCGPYVQSQRLPLYKEWAEKLVADGHAYRCYCSAERLAALREHQRARKEPVIGYDRRCRSLTAAERAEQEASGAAHVVRFAMPIDGQTHFTDLVREIRPFDNNQYRDPILLKSDGFPTYHFANVLDDHFMAITHILRGDEWLSSVPLHVNLYAALGWDIPQFAHLPLILDPSGEGKLSKRKGKVGEDEELLTYVSEHREAGYLPDALFNFLATMGWSYSPDTDLFSRQEAVAVFDIADINPAAGALPLSKLQWMNGFYIRRLAPADLTEALAPFLSAASGIAESALRAHPAIHAIGPLVQERLKTLNEAWNWVDFLFADAIDCDPAMLIAKGLDAAGSLAALEAAQAKIESSPFTEEALDASLRGLAQRLQLKPAQLFGILRVAVTGKSVAPPLFGSMMALGREHVLARCARASEALRTLNGTPDSS